MTSEGWELVGSEAGAYDSIEANEMRPCETSAEGKRLLYCLEPEAGLEQEAAGRAADALTGNCRTCQHRVRKFAPLTGCGGRHVAFCQEMSDPHLDAIRRLRDSIPKSQDVSDYRLVVIDQEFMDRYPVEVGGFTHIHFTCGQLTSPDVAAKIQDLCLYFNGSFDNRFQRLVDDPSSLQVIQQQIPHLVRPDHWRAVTEWAVNFVARARGHNWAELSAHQRFEVMTYAMLTGRSNGSVHADMQQASNLVDFMDGARDEHALRAMMDERSNPETYQVSRVAELLREKAVTSLCTVTLTWGGEGRPHKSDLDLHTKVGGQELYYGTKKVGKCQLDFDANASSVEKHPAENISLNQVGSFVFRVNNYNNRDGADVPFEVTVRKPGFSEVHSGVWPAKRRNGDFVTVCSVTVTAEDLEGKPVELSEAEQRKLAAKEAEWARLFGEPTSTVATADDAKVATVVQQSALPVGRATGGRGAQAA
eukprot:CAMPEP_0179126530 /NCGR_PEP_ID=MMETSP0796-20121207/59897_1 /TAXON_ID=73915 /ORGANISM="Pyrodinium bahamense, Strain pbaha01" /LENGTH=476 /DNA_ID=CAMNT_0020825283 /DNA_START=71 /DNA_END=1498 /DNA_ORIENTATION=+